MKVSFITSSWLDRDGYGWVLSSFVDNFIEKGAEVRVYHSNNAHVDLSSGAVIVASLSELLDAAISGGDEFLFQSDIVFISYLTYYPLMEICRFINPGKVIFFYPGITPYYYYPEWDPLREFTREALGHLGILEYGDAVIVNSEYMVSELAEISGLRKDLIKVLPLSVNSGGAKGKEAGKSLFKDDVSGTEVCSAPIRPGKFNQRWTEDVKHGPVLLYVGRITGNKRVDLLLKGLAILKITFPGVRLIVAGMHKRIFPGRYMEDLKMIIEDLGIGENVFFKSDLLSSELNELYNSADLFVTASLHEGFCLPVAEALSHALPAVVPHVTATKETMGGGGITYEAENMDEFAEVVSRLLTTKFLYEDLSEKALEESHRFSPEIFSRNIDSLIEEVLSSHGLNSGISDSSGKRGLSRINLCDARSHHHTVYKDSLSIPLIGPLLRWLRRKVTFPVEKSVLRPVVEQQSHWNQLMVKEVRELRRQIEALETLSNDNSVNKDSFDCSGESCLTSK